MRFRSWIRPDQVTRMTDAQAAQGTDAERVAWIKESTKSSKGEISGRWYAVNTRESIRDDTIRAGFIANGVVVEREGLATTSPAPRYALAKEFADLFDSKLTGKSLKKAIADWQADHLSAGALARITMVRKGAVAGGEHVLVKFPSGETRRMAPGPSSIISKAVIEVFAPRFLQRRPAFPRNTSCLSPPISTAVTPPSKRRSIHSRGTPSSGLPPSPIT